jgi:hypothetical protein
MPADTPGAAAPFVRLPVFVADFAVLEDLAVFADSRGAMVRLTS